MSNNNSSSASGGSFLTSLLLAAFVVLKLCGIITWSWLWVLSPMWIPLAVVALALLVFAAILLVGSIARSRRRRR